VLGSATGVGVIAAAGVWTADAAAPLVAGEAEDESVSCAANAFSTAASAVVEPLDAGGVVGSGVTGAMFSVVPGSAIRQGTY
jgi:hypothetical protein